MNKKLIKTIASITCGLGIVTSIPLMSTSCGCSAEHKALPNTVYKLDENDPTILLGFNQDFLDHQDDYKNCDTIKIPNGIKSISDFAFSPDLSPQIPSYITRLICNDDLDSIGKGSFFDSSSLTYICLSKEITSIESNSFHSCNSINTIVFRNGEGIYGLATNLGPNAQVVVEKDQDNNYIWSNDNLVAGKLACGDIILPEGIDTLNQSAFSNCWSITSIFIPQTLLNFNEYCFTNCDSLTYIKWEIENDFSQYHISTYAFSGIAAKGRIECLGTMYDSVDLLNWLQDNDNPQGYFPTEGWIPF